MKIKISFTEEERAIAESVEQSVVALLNKARIKRVDDGDQYKQIYLTTKVPKKP